MSEQSFHRPGAVDLSGLKQSAQQPSGGQPGAAGASGGAGSAYAVTLTEQNFQEVLESSQTAPVVLVFYSPSQDASSQQLAQDMATVAGEYDGRFLAGLVDIDASPQIAQAMQVPSVPLVVAVVSGRPMPLLQEAVSVDDLRAVMQQVLQQLTSQGITGRHQPREAAPAEGEEDGEEQAGDPRYAAAQEALGAGDIDTAVAEYQKLVDANPADSEAAAGLSMARLLQRTQGVDLNAARQQAADAPDDVDAQIMCADLDLLGGHVEDAFSRLIEFVRTHAGDDRDTAREHLVELFSAVGNDDERVQRGRQSLASALF